MREKIGNIKVIFNSMIYGESSNWDDEIMKYLGDLCDSLAENQKRDYSLINYIAQKLILYNKYFI